VGTNTGKPTRLWRHCYRRWTTHLAATGYDIRTVRDLLEPKGVWTIVIVGRTVPWEVTFCPNTGEVMYWLAPWDRRRGIATKAVALLCEWALTGLGFTHITLKTNMDNVASQRVAERAGFHRVEPQGDNKDQPGTVWYVLLGKPTPGNKH